MKSTIENVATVARRLAQRHEVDYQELVPTRRYPVVVGGYTFQSCLGLEVLRFLERVEHPWTQRWIAYCTGIQPEAQDALGEQEVGKLLFFSVSHGIAPALGLPTVVRKTPTQVHVRLGWPIYLGEDRPTVANLVFPRSRLKDTVLSEMLVEAMESCNQPDLVHLLTLTESWFILQTLSEETLR